MVFTRLRELDVQNYEPYAIIGIIGFSLADIYRAKLARSSGRSVADVAKDFSYAKNREFAVKNAYSECGYISAERIGHGEKTEICSPSSRGLQGQWR